MINFFPGFMKMSGFSNLLDSLYSGFANTDIETSATGEKSITSKIEGMSIQTKINTDKVVEINVTFDTDVDITDEVISVVLLTTEPYFNSSMVKGIIVNIKCFDNVYVFKGDVDKKMFTTVRNGVEGFMSISDTDGIYRFTPNEVPSVTTDDTETEYVDETHVYSDDEQNAYANFMCNVVCGDCKESCCDNCEVIVGSESDGDFVDSKFDCYEDLPWEDDVTNNEFSVPTTVSDHDFAGFIKNKVNSRVHYICEDDMMNKLRAIFVNGEYEVENDCVIVPLEDLIKTNTYLEDVDVAKNILNYESEELTAFLDSAANKFGFKCACYEVDTMFNCVDLKFSLPE